jgi:hypothetical protein
VPPAENEAAWHRRRGEGSALEWARADRTSVGGACGPLAARGRRPAVYLYYRPIASYLETRDELAAGRAEVGTLRIVKAELELRLATSTSVEATRREARRIGYVLPGEQLFVIKGIPDWRRAQRTLQDDG